MKESSEFLIATAMLLAGIGIGIVISTTIIKQRGADVTEDHIHTANLNCMYDDGFASFSIQDKGATIKYVCVSGRSGSSDVVDHPTKTE